MQTNYQPTAPLIEEEKRLLEREHELTEALRQVAAERRRVTDALDLLLRRKKKQTRKIKRPPATAGDVKAVIRTIAKEQPSLSKDHLFSEVEKRVVANGKSKVGLKLRFNEVLKTLPTSRSVDRPNHDASDRGDTALS